MSSTPVPSRAFDDRALDFGATATLLSEMGFGEITPTTIRGLAYRGTLPFFKGPTGKLVIMESALRSWIIKRQNEALHEAARKESATTRASNSRRSRKS